MGQTKFATLGGEGGDGMGAVCMSFSRTEPLFFLNGSAIQFYIGPNSGKKIGGG